MCRTFAHIIKMLRRLNLLKITVIFVTYFGVQLILHEIETIRFLERIRIRSQTNQDLERINFLNDFEDTFEVILVVQVQENNIDSLNKLLQSLENSKFIENSLIIFSHLNNEDESLNKLIKTIKFAKTIQIFFPYSRRNSKHHFWWTLNHVFDDVIDDFDGLVLILKDEHIVSPDFLSVLSLVKERKENYDSTQLICLGTKNSNYSQENYNKVRIEARCLKITEKVSFNIASEASYVYIL